MHAIKPPTIKRVDVLDDECHLDLVFPDGSGASSFGHDAAALLDQGVDVDIRPSAGTVPGDHWPGRPGQQDSPSSPTQAEMLARGLRHDLQGPLTVVRSFIDLALEQGGADLSDEVRTSLEQAGDAGERLQAMVEGIGELGTQSDVDRRRQAVELDDVLDDALENLGTRSEADRVTMVRGSLPYVRGDPGSLSRVLQNLVANALDHTDGEILLRVDAVDEDDVWRVRVVDDGPGVPVDEQDRVFDPLSRGAHADGVGGGVGLAVCRRVVESHGGEVGLESTPGEGATFWFTLPKADTSE